MIEAFYSGAAGLKSHESAVDNISNNIANINTVGYKSKEVNFNNLLASSMMRPETQNSQTLIAGSGSAILGEKTDMTQGPAVNTGLSTNFYINGDGYFTVETQNGQKYFTRDGSFNIFRGNDGGFYLGNSKGMYALDANGNRISAAEGGTPQTKPGVVTFANEEGLVSEGGNLYAQTNLSGAPVASNTHVIPGYTESSNVDLATEMSNLIMAQRNYQMNSSVVQTSNQIEQMVNELGQQ